MADNLEIDKCFAGAYRGKRVLVTGHTGFKGAWLCEWLLALGADVTGFALPSPTSPALFEQLGLCSRVTHVLGDVRDLPKLREVVGSTRPDFVFHLAAQSLVRTSYLQPAETFETNVMGTVNLLEAVRSHSRPCIIVAITTDKCYENKEWVHGYREEDPLGGYDPYSSSKGAAELAISAYRRSFFSAEGSPIKLASARAGNVIGGGDWAMDRIVPDCVRSLVRGDAIPVRNRTATRPWQHVLEPLSGYLWLAASLSQPSSHLNSLFSSPSQFSTAFNFGPALASNKSVADLVQEVLKQWPGSWVDKSNPREVHEATLLNLTTDKAFHYLKWKPIWNFEETIARTALWYRETHRGTDVGNSTRNDITAYVAAGSSAGAPWAWKS